MIDVLEYRGFVSLFEEGRSAGIHPQVINAILRAQVGEPRAGWQFEFLQEVQQTFRDHFGSKSHTVFVWDKPTVYGKVFHRLMATAGDIFCGEHDQLFSDRYFLHQVSPYCRLFPIGTQNGKIVPQLLAHVLKERSRSLRPKVVMIPAVTDAGQVFTIAEYEQIADVARSYQAHICLDGTGLFNAAATLDVTLGELVKAAGAHAVLLSGSGNGMMPGEAIVFAEPGDYQSFELPEMRTPDALETRFLAFQFQALLKDELYKEIGGQANAMAMLLQRKIVEVNSIKVEIPQSNIVIANMPESLLPLLAAGGLVSEHHSEGKAVKLTCSFDTSPEEIIQFTNYLHKLCSYAVSV